MVDTICGQAENKERAHITHVSGLFFVRSKTLIWREKKALESQEALRFSNTKMLEAVYWLSIILQGPRCVVFCVVSVDAVMFIVSILTFQRIKSYRFSDVRFEWTM